MYSKKNQNKKCTYKILNSKQSKKCTFNIVSKYLNIFILSSYLNEIRLISGNKTAVVFIVVDNNKFVFFVCIVRMKYCFVFKKSINFLLSIVGLASRV